MKIKNKILACIALLAIISSTVSTSFAATKIVADTLIFTKSTSPTGTKHVLVNSPEQINPTDTTLKSLGNTYRKILLPGTNYEIEFYHQNVDNTNYSQYYDLEIGILVYNSSSIDITDFRSGIALTNNAEAYRVGSTAYSNYNNSSPSTILSGKYKIISLTVPKATSTASNFIDGQVSFKTPVTGSVSATVFYMNESDFTNAKNNGTLFNKILNSQQLPPSSDTSNNQTLDQNAISFTYDFGASQNKYKAFYLNSGNCGGAWVKDPNELISGIDNYSGKTVTGDCNYGLKYTINIQNAQGKKLYIIPTWWQKDDNGRTDTRSLVINGSVVTIAPAGSTSISIPTTSNSYTMTYMMPSGNSGWIYFAIQ